MAFFALTLLISQRVDTSKSTAQYDMVREIDFLKKRIVWHFGA